MRDAGTVYNPDCTQTLKVFDSYLEKRRNRLDYKVEIDKDFAWEEIDPQWPKFDFKVYHTTSPDLSKTGLKL